MNADKLNVWLTLAANVGVLVGVVFLVVELNQNTRALTVQNMWNATSTATDLNVLLAENDEIRELVQRALNDPESLTEAELFKAQFPIRLTFNLYMAQYWTHEEYGMPEARWAGFVANFNNFANTPGGRKFLQDNAETFTKLSEFATPGPTRQLVGFGIKDADATAGPSQ